MALNFSRMESFRTYPPKWLKLAYTQLLKMVRTQKQRERYKPFVKLCYSWGTIICLFSFFQCSPASIRNRHRQMHLRLFINWHPYWLIYTWSNYQAIAHSQQIKVYITQFASNIYTIYYKKVLTLQWNIGFYTIHNSMQTWVSLTEINYVDILMIYDKLLCNFAERMK